MDLDRHTRRQEVLIDRQAEHVDRLAKRIDRQAQHVDNQAEHIANQAKHIDLIRDTMERATISANRRIETLQKDQRQSQTQYHQLRLQATTVLEVLQSLYCHNALLRNPGKNIFRVIVEATGVLWPTQSSGSPRQ